MSLKQQTIIGISWSFLENVINQAIQFIIGIILARLLTPAEFGLVGMLTIFISISQVFIDSGFSQALIRKQDCNKDDYNTVFFFNIVVAVFFYLVLFILAGSISSFFNEPKLSEIVKILSLSIIINSFGIVQTAQLTKEINIKTQTKISVISNTGAGLISIYLALTGYGVWSLVWRTILSNLFRIIFLWYWNKWRPGLSINFKSFNEMFSFGSKYMVSVLLHNISENIYYLVIGKYFSAQQLGYYTRSLSFSNLLSFNINHVISRVSYPVLSKLQDDNIKLKNAYRLLVKDTMFITFFALIILAAISEPLIITLIGEKWRQAIPYLQLLSFASLLIPLHLLNLNILLVKGRTDIYLNLEIVKKILIIPIVYFGIKYGIEKMIIGMIAHSLISFIMNSHFSGRIISYSTVAQAIDILPRLTLALIVGVLIYLIPKIINIAYMYLLIIQLTIGFILFLGIAAIIKVESFFELKKMFLSKLK
ncbi:MAG: lipopolysaccharide biosynthesis protein [Ignavibacterium album]|uniref:lipopolysaccharide biosynthesis protein n=1 Tax=Ignavibacterium album TaxID=591197 RepID=UPI0026F14387|nr:lipopolysaccharide biosynthesis protein [Ignavibacterium album]MCX8104708.1 lipopolysaccharide biosynthesis protein [Ignavibacterium album]